MSPILCFHPHILTSRSNVPSEEDHLLRCSRALAKAWEKFQKELPKHQQNAMHDRPPSLEVLFDAVRDANTSWKTSRRGTRWGKVKSSFARLSASADDHSQLLEMLPKNDKYMCLITGALTVIAQAAKNHEELAASMSEVVNSLCDDISHWKRQILAHRDVPAMQTYVRELYVVIFEFFTDLFIGWSKSGWRRFGKAFDKNATDKLFTSKQEQICKLTEKLDREARLDTEEKVAAMHQNMSRQWTRIGVDKVLWKLGCMEQTFLERSNLRKVVVGRSVASENPSFIASVESEDAAPENWVDEQPTRYERRDVLAAIPGVESILTENADKIQTSLHKTTTLQVDTRVFSTLRDWTAGKGTRCIWLQGPAHVPSPSQINLTAIALAGTASNSGVLAQLFLCGFVRGRRLSAQQNLRRAVLSMIVQNMITLPEAFSSGHDFSPERVESCTGQRSSISDAIDLLKQVNTIVSSPAMRIIDDFQALEDRSDLEHTRALAALVDILSGNEAFTVEVDKVCFTTSGFVDVLARQTRKGKIRKAVVDSEVGDVDADDGTRLRGLRLQGEA